MERKVRYTEIIENSVTNGKAYKEADHRIPRGVLDDSVFSRQLYLASLEFKTASTQSRRKQVREDINRMRTILERYAANGLLDLVSRDFPTVQSIADALSDMRCQEIFNRQVEIANMAGVKHVGRVSSYEDPDEYWLEYKRTGDPAAKAMAAAILTIRFSKEPRDKSLIFNLIKT